MLIAGTVDVEILEIWIAVGAIVEASGTSFFLVSVYCDGGGGGTIFGYHLPGMDTDITFIAWQKSKASEFDVYK
jgi:hypothetical protein